MTFLNIMQKPDMPEITQTWQFSIRMAKRATKPEKEKCAVERVDDSHFGAL